MKLQDVQRENRRLKRRLASTSRKLDVSEFQMKELKEEVKKKVEAVPFLNGIISELRNGKSELKGEIKRLSKELVDQAISPKINTVINTSKNRELA